jgi:sulfoxide reductase heme-binding subunit YedZ
MIKITDFIKNRFVLLVNLVSWMPLVFLAKDTLTNNLTFNPIQAATLRTGKLALIFLLLSLACTPISSLLKFKLVLKVRRTLGLFAFMYAAIHVLIFFVLDYGLDLRLIWNAVIEKRYILAGAGAFLILLPLALTSFKWWMKSLGKNWKRLHRLVYLAGVFVIVHYIWLVKSDIRVPLLYGAVLLLFLLVRVKPVKSLLLHLKPKTISFGRSTPHQRKI